jgi:antitoxin ParD1/3/4
MRRKRMGASLPGTERGAMTFRIHLHREGEAFIQRMLDARRYESASDVVFHALLLLEDREKLRDLQRAELLAKIQEGVDAADRGELIDAEEVFDRLLAKYGDECSTKEAAE